MKRDEDEQKPREQRESFTRRREHISRSLTFFSGNSSAEREKGDFFALKSLLPNAKNFSASFFSGRRRRAAHSLNKTKARLSSKSGLSSALFPSGTSAQRFLFQEKEQVLYSFSVVSSCLTVTEERWILHIFQSFFCFVSDCHFFKISLFFFSSSSLITSHMRCVSLQPHKTTLS